MGSQGWHWCCKFVHGFHVISTDSRSECLHCHGVWRSPCRKHSHRCLPRLPFHCRSKRIHDLGRRSNLGEKSSTVTIINLLTKSRCPKSFQRISAELWSTSTLSLWSWVMPSRLGLALASSSGQKAAITPGVYRSCFNACGLCFYFAVFDGYQKVLAGC
jgi:hypothetical protein